MNTRTERLATRNAALAGRLAAGLASVLVLATARGASVTWDAGGGANLAWAYQSVPGTFDNWSDDGDPSGDSLTFNNSGVAGAAGTATNTVGSSVSVASLAYTNYGASANYHTTQIDNGVTLTVTGGMTAGPAAAGTCDVTIQGSTAGAGALALTGGNFSVYNPVTWSTVAMNLTMRDLGAFTANVGNFDVNYTGPYSGASVRLAATNTITANNLRMGNWGGNAGGYLYLGQSNTLNIDNVYVCGINLYNGAKSYVYFDSGLTDPTLVLRNKAGTGRVNLLSIGDRPTVDNPSEKIYGTVDFSGGTVDVLVNQLVIGSAGGRAAAGNSEEAFGYLTIAAGVIDATTIRLGRQTKAGNWNSAWGYLTINGGTVIADSLIIGDQQEVSGGSYARGTLALNGGTLRAASIQAGARNAFRYFNFSSGTLQNKAGGDLVFGADIPVCLLTAAGHSIVADPGRSVTLNSPVTYGNGGTGGLAITGGGTVVMNATGFYPGTTSIAGATLLANGAAVAAGVLTGNITVNTPTITGLSSTAGLALGQPVSGTNIPAGAYILRIDSASQITLSANATNTGSRSLSFAAGAALGTGPVTVGTGGTLGGTGPVAGAITVSGGQLAPGSSAGTLTANSTVTFDNTAGGTLGIEVGGLTAGTFDVLNVAGALGLAGANDTLNVSVLGPFYTAPGDQVTFLNAGSITGGFDHLRLFGLAWPGAYSVDTVGNAMVLTFNIAIPEPAALATLLLAAGAVAARRRVRGAA